MVLEINGINVLPYIAFRGFKWQRGDLDAPDSGRTQNDGKMHRGRVTTKIRLDVTCRPLLLQEASLILKLIYPEYVTVRYTDPMEGTVITKTMYSNNNPASFCIRKDNGLELWDGITFPLVER